MEDSQKYKRLIESLENEYFFYSHTLDGKYLYISPSVEKILGYTVEEAFGGLVKYMTSGEINKKALDIQKKSASGEKQQTFEFELYTKNHEVKVIEITESPLYDENGKMISIEGVAHDITKRKKSEQIIKQKNEELSRQKSELQEALQNLKDTQEKLIHSEKMGALGNLISGIAHEINTPIGAINASVGNISGSLDSSMQNIFKLINHNAKEELDAFMQIMLMTEITKSPLTSKQKRELRKEVTAKLKEADIENALSAADHIMYLNLFRETDKIISIIKNKDSEFILKAARDIYSVRKNAENIILAVEKASNVILALKRFIHKDQSGIKEKTDLIQNIETVLTLQYNELKQGIEVVRDYHEIPQINCYPDELVQVWTNLISNAIQAMNYKGTITISVEKRNSNIDVKISDTGTGIPEKYRQKIFEPFFTTKKAGEGTGIGLDIVQKIIKKHNATIDFESEVGKGTTFLISLPVS